MDNDAWFVDSGAFSHWMGMKELFLSVSGMDSNCYVDSGVDTIHAVRGVGCVRFQLE